MTEDVVTPGTLSYHLDELAIAKNASDPRRCLPNIHDAEDLLDIGCGAGQTLEALEATGLKVGIDIDVTTLKLGRRLFPSLLLVCGSGDRLPFRDEQFDLVLSRVAVPYMRFPASVKEMHRVTVNEGRIWLSLHPFRLAWERITSAGRALKARAFVYSLYVLANGGLLHWFGRTVSFPLRHSRHESFQTGSGMRRVLTEAGYVDVRVRSDQHLVVEGRRLTR